MIICILRVIRMWKPAACRRLSGKSKNLTGKAEKWKSRKVYVSTRKDANRKVEKWKRRKTIRQT